MRKHYYDFNVAGVTAGKRQDLLRKLRNAILKKARNKDDFNFLASRIKVKLKPEPDNPHDKHAIKVLVWSRLDKVWRTIGYVPHKRKIGKKETPMNVFVGLLIKRELITRVSIEDIDVFERRDKGTGPAIVHFCKVGIEFSK